MDQNRGIAPLDPSTDIGRFRLMAGDATSTPLDPPEAGFGSYETFSDAEIQAFLDMAGGRVSLAIALAYTSIAAAWAASSSDNIKADDLAVNNVNKVSDWLKLAAFWQSVADNEAAASGDDGFEIVHMGNSWEPHPEAAPYVVGSGGDFGW